MKWLLFSVLGSLICLTISQHISTIYRPGSNNQLQGRQEAFTNIQTPFVNKLASGIQIAKQVPYVEMLKFIEAFLRLKGEVAGRAWALVYDNSHILAALRDVFISKIATIHSLTLNALIALRKILEFAATLFSNVNAFA